MSYPFPSFHFLTLGRRAEAHRQLDTNISIFPLFGIGPKGRSPQAAGSLTSSFPSFLLYFKVAMVEISIDSDAGDGNGTTAENGKASEHAAIPESLLIIFAVCTTLLVSVHLVALMISTCILPNMEAVSNVHSVQAVNESPHDEMRLCVEMAWVCSTGLGILLFLAEIAILSWVKFYRLSKKAAITSTAIVIPAGLLFIVFSLVFYKRLMAHKYQRHTEGLRELDEMARELHTNDDNIRIV